MHDVIVIGGGLAGLTSAMACAQYGLNTIVISRRIGGSINETPIVETLPGIRPIFGPDLAKKLQEECKSAGVEFRESEISEIRSGFTLYNIADHANEKHKAKAIIIATGRSPQMLEIAGEEEFLGKGITTNPISDLETLQNNSVAVYGSGERAGLTALWLSSMCQKVHLICPKPRLHVTPLTNERIQKTLRIETHLNSAVKKISGSINLESVATEKAQMNVSGLVLCERGRPHLSFLKVNMQISDGIAVDSAMKTSAKGIFACGNVLSGEEVLAPETVMQAWQAAESAYKFVRGK
ncbi:MAG: FAD-binding protein [Nanoarchaeota archaeon]|nr:MAG: FAD-binding protein [Nanoarchaeota archaeon]